MGFRTGGYFRGGGGIGGGGGDMTGAEIATALTGLNEGARDAFLADMATGLVGNDELWKNNADSSGVVGEALVEQVIADPSDVAGGINTTLGLDIASTQFWRIRYSVAQAATLTIHLPGSSTTASATNHTLNVRVLALTAAVTWQIEEIAAGLEDVEGMITFVNGEANTNNCFPQNHASTGATVQYVDGVVQGDLVVPTGSGSTLTVFYRILTTGATGLFAITGYVKDTA